MSQGGEEQSPACAMHFFAVEETIMHVPHAISALAGKAIRPIRAGDSKLISRVIGLPPHTLRVHAIEFSEGEPMPAQLSGPAAPSPHIMWQDAPSEVKEYVLVCQDPDAPMAAPFVHWVVYGIPASLSELQPDVPKTAHPSKPAGVHQAQNGTKEPGFTGAAPPAGHGVHHYHFQVFGLDAPISVRKELAELDDVVDAMKGHVIAFGETVGTYENK